MDLEREGVNLHQGGFKVQGLRKFEQKAELMERHWDEFSLQVGDHITKIYGITRQLNCVIFVLLRCVRFTVTVQQLQEMVGRRERRRCTKRSPSKQPVPSATFM